MKEKQFLTVSSENDHRKRAGYFELHIVIDFEETHLRYSRLDCEFEEFRNEIKVEFSGESNAHNSTNHFTYYCPGEVGQRISSEALTG